MLINIKKKKIQFIIANTICLYIIIINRNDIIYNKFTSKFVADSNNTTACPMNIRVHAIRTYDTDVKKPSKYKHIDARRTDIFVHPAANLILCLPSKSGSTNFKIRYFQANNITVPRTALHGRHRLYSQGFVHISLLSKLKAKHCLDRNDYTRVMLVRHPLIRLLSAYLDKVVSCRMENVCDYIIKSRSWKRRHPQQLINGDTRMQNRSTQISSQNIQVLNIMDNSTNPTNASMESSFESNGSRASSYNVQFSDFLEWVIEGRPEFKNQHWRQQILTCRTDLINYDVVIRAETSRRDFNITENLLNIEYLDDQRIIPKTNIRVFRQYYSQVSSDLLSRVLKVYKHSMDKLGYNLHDYLEPRCRFSLQQCC